MAEPIPERSQPCAPGSSAAACFAAFGVAVAAALLGQALGHDLIDKWLLSTRYTARFSVELFLLAYVAPAFVGSPTGAGAWLVRKRCPLSLSFAIAHTVHLGCILTYFAFRHEIPSATGIVIGGTGYVVLYAMLVTGWSWIATDGVRWRRLHAAGPHYLWFVVFATYASRVAERGVEFAPYLLLTLVALAIRVRARWRAPRWEMASVAR